MLRCSLLFATALSAGLSPSAVAQESAQLRCSWDEAPAQPCAATFATNNGVRHAVFEFGERRVVFEGKAQSGWWVGTLDGAPATGFERNRGHVVYTTHDLEHRFAWYYPRQQHGSY